METFLIKALQLIIALSLLVLVHEFGHYFFSRIFGVWVEKFYIFFNPTGSIMKYNPRKKLLKFFSKNSDDVPSPEGKSSWRDTEYGIGWVPLGGYCKIAGMIDESMDKEQMAQPEKPYEFRAKPAYQRLLIMVGGVLFNFLLAFVIYAGIVYSWGEEFITFRNVTEGMKFTECAHNVGFKDGDILLKADGHDLDVITSESIQNILLAKSVTVLRDKNDTVTVAIPSDFVFAANKDAENGEMFMTARFPVVISQTQPGMGAEKAGLEKGDRVVSVAGVPTPSYDLFVEEAKKCSDKKVAIGVMRNGKEITAEAEIDSNGKLGFLLTPINEIYETTTHEYSLLESFPRGIELGWEKTVGYVKSLKLIFSKEGAESIGGFGAIGNIFPDKWNWYGFWSITAILSVMLGVMNILPIPALDGGHVMFLLYEIVMRRKPSDKFLERAQMVGMFLLFALLIYANGNDIYRFIFK